MDVEASTPADSASPSRSSTPSSVAVTSTSPNQAGHRDSGRNVGTSADRRAYVRDSSVSHGRKVTDEEEQKPQQDPRMAHQEPCQNRKLYILRICRSLMQYGAPTHRLEDYMQQTASILDIKLQSFYLPGCMFISFGNPESAIAETHIVRCTQSLNLTKLYQAHRVYKDIIHSNTSPQAAIASLDSITAAKDQFSPLTRVSVYGLASMSIGPVSYGARPIDLPLIFVLGCLLGASELILAPRSELFSQVFEIFTTILIAFLARALGSINLPHAQRFCFSALCQASLVMILPGFIVTNSALELQSKHIIAGSVRLVYGLVFILFLAFGITIGTSIYGALDSNATSLTSCSPAWPFWWQIMFVPLFTVAWIVVNQAPWRRMPAMVAITLAGWSVNHFSGQFFYLNTIISQTLGALTVGILANLYSRVGHELAAALLHPAVFIQVPGSLAASGGLVSGIQSADALNHRTGSQDMVSHPQLLAAGYAMVEIAIGITVGLSVSALLVYPFRKKKGKSGIFSF